MSRLDEIKARLAEATPGPWNVIPCEDDRLTRIATTGPVGHRKTLARTSAMFGRPHVPHADCEPNATLIAHAPADLAWLVKCVEHQARRLACTGCGGSGCEYCCDQARELNPNPNEVTP